MEIEPSALRHGQTVADIQHAIRHHVATSDVATRQRFPATGTPYIGPNLAANMIEVISIDDPTDGEVVIHAMPLRRSYARRLLGDGS